MSAELPTGSTVGQVNPPGGGPGLTNIPIEWVAAPASLNGSTSHFRPPTNIPIEWVAAPASIERARAQIELNVALMDVTVTAMAVEDAARWNAAVDKNRVSLKTIRRMLLKELVENSKAAQQKQNEIMAAMEDIERQLGLTKS